MKDEVIHKEKKNKCSLFKRLSFLCCNTRFGLNQPKIQGIDKSDEDLDAFLVKQDVLMYQKEFDHRALLDRKTSRGL